MMQNHISSQCLKKNFNIILFTICLLSSTQLFAQQIINKSSKAFNNAKLLYDNNILQSARNSFETYINEYSNEARIADAKYYIASIAVKLNHDDGEALMQSFVNDYTFNPNAKNAYLDLGRHFYKNKKYKKSKDYYGIAEANDAELIAEDLFNYGYCQFNLKAFDESMKIFQKIEVSSNFFKDAAYFIGYMAFESQDLILAKSSLEQAFESQLYGLEAIKIYSYILYNANNYQVLIDLIEEQLPNTKDAELLKTKADAHFEIKQFEEAAYTYTKLFGWHAKYRTHQSYYRAGVSYLNVSDLDNSIDNLKRAALSKDSLGAYASYQLGILYANDDNLLFASSSFANAAKFETSLKEEAEFLRAKIEFDLKNYDQAITYLQVYQKDYPNSSRHDLANELLSEAYLNTKNYDRAISYIESLQRLSPKTKEAYQRVAYLKGMDLYNAGRYIQAIEYFKKSLTYTTDKSLETESYYYIGESYSQMKQFKDAQFYYEQAIDAEMNPVSLQSKYSLAYTHFNLQSYQEALRNFQAFENENSNVLNIKYNQDALLRMGDCAYVMKDYDQSIEYYNNALSFGSKQQAYIHFQKGLVYRYATNIEEAKLSFNVVLNEYANSDLADDALFQISQIEFESGNYELTIEYSQKLIKGYPESKYLPYALLNEAVAQNNIGNPAVSISNYKSIIDRFPRHTTANSALLGLQEFSGAGKFNDFEAYLTRYKSANPNSEALENIDFETAKALFYNQNYDRAINDFSIFRSTYPESALINDATYFLADSWFRKNNQDKSLEYYYLISDKHDYSKYRRIQQRIANLEQLQNDYETSNKYFYRLKASKGNFKDLNNSNFGLMSNYFVLAQFDSAIIYGNYVLDGERISNEMMVRTYLYLGKANYLNKKIDLAVDWFVLLLNDSPDERGAEAKFYISKILFEKGEYNNSLQSLFTLKDEYRMFDFWVGQAFLLMADNYLALDEVFQAKATLNSVIENVKIETIKKEAELKLAIIENNELIKQTDTLSIDDN